MRAFVAMSTKKAFSAVYDVVKSVCNEHNVTPVRQDQLSTAKKKTKKTNVAAPTLFEQVLSELRACDFVVADLTGADGKTGLNVDVVYQLGIARQANKPTILLAQQGENLPFDLEQHRAIRYTAKPKDLAVMEGRLHEAMGLAVDKVKQTSKIYKAPRIPVKGATKVMVKLEGRRWRKRKRVPLPKGRTSRGPYKEGSADERRRALFDQTFEHWDMFESDMSALAKKLCPSWVHGVTDAAGIVQHVRALASAGGFVEHLHIVASTPDDGTGGFRIGGEVVNGYWDGFKFGQLLAEGMCLPGTITLWASTSGLACEVGGSTIAGIAAGSGSKVAGLNASLLTNKKNQDRWRANPDEKDTDWAHGSQRALHWDVAYPDGAYEEGAELGPSERDRAVPFGPVDFSGKRENEDD